MDNSNLQQLIDKYLQGTISVEEKKRLLRWYRQQQDQETVWTLEPGETEKDVSQRIKSKIWSDIATPPSRKRIYWPYVAVAATLLLASFVVFMRTKSGIVEQQISFSKSEGTNNRFILLPDSSRVVLRAGTKLTYPNSFSGQTREVNLEGEAYFDIKHKNGQPFIIHTGEVKTTVLGTAFTIKYPNGSNQVEVLVERGKVRVEDSKQVFAELTADQKIDIQGLKVKPAIEKIDVQSAMSWKRQDMAFDALPFGSLAEALEKRYGVSLDFANQTLRNCPISGKFTGSETIEEVLLNICATRNAAYRKTGDGRYEIKGPGCP
ncbi:FecR domain-containing protein [Sphingobacterium sp.]|uniref:FecR family protein n=1 Tax=Sphingobacterium sp. TaxID=341027 RepID=UPI00289FFFC8|nr:FecR domain-containing protein [Sphingobacterium sp.]